MSFKLEEAAMRLIAGELVIFPTETVFGVGADARNPAAVAKIYAAKGRPAHNPLIVHVPDTETAKLYGVFDARAERLAALFWPGALTLVVPLRSDAGLASAVTAGLATVALRVPAHPLAHSLLAHAACPIAAPSANLSGRLSPTRAGDVDAALLAQATLLDDGSTGAVGVESTIVALDTDGWRLLRPGAVTLEDITAALEESPRETGAGIRAPGMLTRHYAPQTPLRLNAEAAEPGEAFVGFGHTPGATHMLSERGDLVDAARNLYALLHTLDNQGYTAIAIAPIPNAGLGKAVNDRLQRAASCA